MKLEIPVTDMTPQVMEQLEKDGLIQRLCPGHEHLEAPKGETTWRLMYEPKEGFGPHRLITIRVNREPFAGFGTHPDCEEFWLIGSEDTQPMYLAICRLSRESLEKAVAEQSLRTEDFVMLRVRYNDPQVSFFVMNANVPHGEAIVDRQKPPAAFYVTESRDLPLDLIDLAPYELKVGNHP